MAHGWRRRRNRSADSRGRVRLARRAGGPRRRARLADAIQQASRARVVAECRRYRQGCGTADLAIVGARIMSNEITMPKLSDTMEEGKILRWLKHPGDKIARGEAIAEVETDKADMILEAFDEGVLDQIKLNEGESAPVGAVIALMKSAGAKEAKAETKADAKPVRAKDSQSQSRDTPASTDAME